MQVKRSLNPLSSQLPSLYEIIIAWPFSKIKRLSSNTLLLSVCHYLGYQLSYTTTSHNHYNNSVTHTDILQIQQYCIVYTVHSTPYCSNYTYCHCSLIYCYTLYYNITTMGQWRQHCQCTYIYYLVRAFSIYTCAHYRYRSIKTHTVGWIRVRVLSKMR